MLLVYLAADLLPADLLPVSLQTQWNQQRWLSEITFMTKFRIIFKLGSEQTSNRSK